MDATQFGEHLQASAKQNGTFGEDGDIIYDILKAISTIPDLGLHLYHEGAVSRSSLTVILPIPGNADLDDTIDECLENIIKEYNPDDRTRLIGSARKAIIGLIANLAIPGMRQAFGNFDSSPWQKPMPSTSKFASLRETSLTAVHDLLHDFNHLSVYNRDWIRSRNYFDNDSDDSSSINCFLEGDPGWSDTDDEVEEANAADDGFKILEGDW